MLKNFVSKYLVDISGEEDATNATASELSAPSVSPVTAAGSTSPGVNSAMVAELKKVVTRRATPYTALEERTAALAEVIPDQTMRTKAAFAVLKSEGRTAHQIIQAIDTHLMDLDGEQRRFTSTSQQASNRSIGALREEIAALSNATEDDNRNVNELREQIARGEERIRERSGNIAAKAAAADAAELELARVVQDFTDAVESVKQGLTQRKADLSSALAQS